VAAFLQWEPIRRALLAACLLEDNTTAHAGNGYTGHCFNDFNHVDCCTMLGNRAHHENHGQVEGIAYGNPLGAGIQRASLDGGEEASGSWCTCQLGAASDPPRDVCHTQFNSAIGFKLVWCPGATTSPFSTFAIVSDDGELLGSGTPSSLHDAPSLRERKSNWRVVDGSKYASACGRLFTSGSS
jgi:hypothetical protein